MKMLFTAHCPQLVWNLVPSSHATLQALLAGFVPWNILSSCPISMTQAVTHALNTDLILYGISKLKQQTNRTIPGLLRPSTEAHGTGNLRLLGVLRAGRTQPAHVGKPDGQFPVRTENTAYLLVLQKTLETHLALNKGNKSFTACGSPGLQSHRSAFLGRIISAPNRISQQTLI